MSLKNETADALFSAINEAVGQTKDIQALHALAEAFSLVAGTGYGSRDSARVSRGVTG
ncbi:hypothetical protein [Mycolicibacterium mageritense]|uniref:hypothetical protein n=1 Tax=Mycolicibacterium mageritense TaxID=53462 RepID=UPI0023F16EA0|nr:hypothetical protein [Mycolicibacterium mageritense]